MSRNYESHFSQIPRANISRTKFDRPQDLKTTFNSGELIPIFKLPVLPGDTNSLKTRVAIRMSTPIKPVMDRAFLDIYYFFVPNRLAWEHWKEFMGENTRDAWDYNQPTYTIPKLVFNEHLADKGSLANYFGIPMCKYNENGEPIYESPFSLKVNHIPIRDYGLIWNYWFRSEAVQRPLYVPTGDDDISYAFNKQATSPDEGYFNNAILGGNPCPVCKTHDYFTSALPEPQRGEDVVLPVADFLPVVSRDELIPLTAGLGIEIPPVWLSSLNGDRLLGKSLGTNDINGRTIGKPSQIAGDSQAFLGNLWAQSEGYLAVTINELRQSLAIQRFLETDARGGTRYSEILRSHFGVISPDARLQNPEYLGGKRININMQQVLQQSATNEVSPQGNTAAFSYTVDIDHSFTKSFTEHGYVIGVCCVRTAQTYQYGLDRDWLMNDRIDFYFPEFAHLGEMPVLNSELYVQGNAQDNEVFGYQEAYGWERYLNNKVTGAFASRAPQSLDFWHYAQEYDSLPTLSEEFIVQSKEPIDRSLAVTSEVEDQFIAQFYFDLTSVRPMPLYSIPGLANHF